MAPPLFDFVENPLTGERIEFLTSDPDLLVMRATWTRAGHRAVEHAHPAMVETFHVLDGRAGFLIGGTHGHEHELGPGEELSVPAGQLHLGWNPTEGPVQLLISMRPALRWAEFTTRLFAGEDVETLLSEFPDEVAPPSG